MLEQKDQISRELLVQVYHWLISSTVLEGYAVSKQPVP
jgi:hypothetical protein